MSKPHQNLGALFDALIDVKFDDGEEFDASFSVDDRELHRLAEVAVQGDDATWGAITANLMRASCVFFASEVLSGPPAAPYNGRFIAAPHHEAWDDLLDAHNRLCVQASRDHGKTYFFDFAYPIWRASFSPNGKGYIFSATQPQASRILEDIKEEIESNPKLQWLIPTKKKQWGSTAITLSNGHKIYARGYGTKIRGAHPDWIVVDDGLNDEDAYSELVRNKHIEYFYTAISNMIVPGGQIIVVGTPFHAADLYADLASNKRYHFAKYAAIKEDGTALWPERYCIDDDALAKLAERGILATSLQAKAEEIGAVRFTREFGCEPISDDMSLFPSKLFIGEPTEQFNVVLGQPSSFWDSIGVHTRYIGVDFAISSTTSADFTVIFVLGLDNAGNRWVCDILRAKGLPYHQQLALIRAAATKYAPDLIYLEANQMQRIFGDELIRTSDLPIHKFVTSGSGKYNPNKQPSGNTTVTNKNTLEGGVPSLRVLLENGKFRIPRGDERSITVTDEWIREMKHFTWLDGKLAGVGAHDDTVMALWIADQACRRGGFSFSTGADDSEGDINDLLDDQMAEPSESDIAAAAQKTKEGLDPALAEMLYGSAIDPASQSSGNLGFLDEDDADDDLPAPAWKIPR